MAVYKIIDYRYIDHYHNRITKEDRPQSLSPSYGHKVKLLPEKKEEQKKKICNDLDTIIK